MNIFRKMADVVRLLTLRDPAGWRGHGEVSDSMEVINEHSALTLSAVWACVNLIAGTISSLPLMVYRTDAAGNRTVAKDHLLYRLLHDSPNFDQTGVDFWDFVTVSLELWGNAYARIERISGRIVALYPIHPAVISVRRLANGSLQYQWTEQGKSYVLTDADVLHIRGFGGSPLGGMSTMHFGRNIFGLARTIDKAAGKTFANGMRPGVTITYEKFLTDPQRKQVEGILEEKYLGAMNAGRPFILEGGQKLDVVDMKPEDAQMLQSRSFSIEEICRLFGVPPFMIGHNEKSSGYPTSLEQQVLTFQKFPLTRRLKRIEKALMKQLLTPLDLAAGISIEFGLEGLLRGDSAARAAFYREMTSIGAMTVNEVRALENLPAVAGGDVPRMQMQNIPITITRQLPNAAQKP